MRRCLVALALVLGGLAAGSARAAGPVVLGEINPRTGLLAVQGTAIHQGILLAVEEANARGGLAGRRIELHSRDDEGAPQRAIAAAEELASRQGAVALIGGYVDSLVGPIAEVADRTRIPCLATASLDERLTRRGNRWFFRVSSPAPYVAATVGIVLDVFKPRAVAIFHSSTPGATQIARRQKEALEQKGVAVPVRVDVETPLGRVKFDATGEPLFYERVIVQIQNGRHVVVYPRERATAAARYPAR